MKVIKITELKDGSANMEYELTQEENRLLKAEAKKRKKRYTTKFVNEVVLQALMDGFHKEEAKKNKKSRSIK